MAEPRERPVYETGKGRLCRACGRARQECRCGDGKDEPVPDRITAVLGMERKGRGGKTVTTIGGLPRNRRWAAELAVSLRRTCGTGGSVSDGTIELQGDHRSRLREVLTARGITVKG